MTNQNENHCVDGPYLRWCQQVRARVGPEAFAQLERMTEDEADAWLAAQGIVTYEHSSLCAAARSAAKEGRAPPYVKTLRDLAVEAEDSAFEADADAWAARHDHECTCEGPSDEALADGAYWP